MKRVSLPMNLLVRSIFIPVFLILFAYPAHATVYQYFDEEGTLIVTDNPYRIKRPKPTPDTKGGSLKLGYREDVGYDYYPVYGSNIREVMASANMNGPFDARENRRFTGQTKWNTGWSYRMNSSYSIAGPEVHVAVEIYDLEFRSDITVLLPMLSESSALGPHDLKIWEDFMQGLLEHEHDHVRIVRDPAYRDGALKKISGIKEFVLPYDPRVETGEAVKGAVEAMTARIGHDMIKEIKRSNDDYDRLTDHGLKPELRQAFFSGQR